MIFLGRVGTAKRLATATGCSRGAKLVPAARRSPISQFWIPRIARSCETSGGQPDLENHRSAEGTREYAEPITAAIVVGVHAPHAAIHTFLPCMRVCELSEKPERRRLSSTISGGPRHRESPEKSTRKK